jgi:HK97 family phage major capsid protein
MAVSTTTAPELTREQVAQILTRPLEAQSVFLAAGPRIFDTSGPLRLPKLGGPIADPGWTAENGLIPERDVDFDEVTLLPSTMDSVKVITRYSNELARQSVVALDAALRDRLVRDVAAKLDTQFLSAAGDGIDIPRGLFAYAGVQTVAVDGALSLDHLLTAWGLALAANVDMSRLRWLLPPGTFTALRKLKDGQQRYQLQPDPTQDGVFRLFGAPVTVTARIPVVVDGGGVGIDTTSAALVDFSQIAVARDLAPSVKILAERYAEYDQQAIRVVARYDAAPLNAQAIVKLTGITV